MVAMPNTLATWVVGYAARGHCGQRFATVRARDGVEAIRRARRPGGEMAGADRVVVLTCDPLVAASNPQAHSRAA